MDNSTNEILNSALETRKDKETLLRALRIIYKLKDGGQAYYNEDGKFNSLKSMIDKRDNSWSGIKSILEQSRKDLEIFESFLISKTKKISTHYEGLTPQAILKIIIDSYKKNEEIDKRLLEILEKEIHDPFDFYWRYPDRGEPFVWFREYPTDTYIPREDYETEKEWRDDMKSEEKKCEFVGCYNIFTISDLLNSYKKIRDIIKLKEDELKTIESKIKERKTLISSLEQKIRERFGNRFPDMLKNSGIEI